MFSTLCCEDFIRVNGYRVQSSWDGYPGLTQATGFDVLRTFRVQRQVITYGTAYKTTTTYRASYCYVVGTLNPTIVSLSNDQGETSTYFPDQTTFLAAETAFFNAGNANGFIYGTQVIESQTYTYTINSVRFSTLTQKIETFYEAEYNRPSRQQEVYDLLFTLDPDNEELNYITTYYVNSGTLVFASRGEEPALVGVTVGNITAAANVQFTNQVQRVTGTNVNAVIQNDYCLISGVGLLLGGMDYQCIKRFDNPVRCNTTLSMEPNQIQLQGPDYSIGLYASTRSAPFPPCCT